MYDHELKEMRLSKYLSMDFETTGLIPYEVTPVGVSIGWKVGEKYKAKYWTLNFTPHGKNKVTWRWFNQKVLTPIWENPEKVLVMHNAKYDLQVAMRRRSPYPLAAGEVWKEMPKCRVEDTMVLSFMVDENIPRKLKELSRILLKKPRLTYEETEGEIAAVLRRGEKAVNDFVELGWKLYMAIRQKAPPPQAEDLFAGVVEDEEYEFAEIISAMPVLTQREFGKQMEPQLRDRCHAVARDKVLADYGGVLPPELIEEMVAKAYQTNIRYEFDRGWRYYRQSRLRSGVLTRFDSLVLAMPTGLTLNVFREKFREKIAPGILKKSQDEADLIMCEYGEEDALDTLRIYDILRAKLTDPRIRQWYEEVEQPFNLLMVEMEIGGVTLDVPLLSVMERDIEQVVVRKLQALKERIAEEHGIMDFNPNAHPQIKALLWDQMKLTPPKWANITASGHAATDAEVMEYLANQGVSICQDFLDLGRVTKLHGTYLRPLLRRASDNFKSLVRGGFNSVGAVTGRVASSKPNLQNIPNAHKMPVVSKGELEAIYTKGEGRPIQFNGVAPRGWSKVDDKDDEFQLLPLRRVFTAPPGYVILRFDLNQIELRAITHMTKDKMLVRAYTQWDCECKRQGRLTVAWHKCPACGAPDGERDVLDPKQPVIRGFCLGLDLHSQTGLNLGLFRKYGPKVGRKMAKPANFGLCYGEQLEKLRRDLSLETIEEAEIYYNAYFALYPKVLVFHEWVLEHLAEVGEFWMIDGGRKRRFHAQRKANQRGQLTKAQLRKVQREIVNNIPQGSAADVMKRGLLEFVRRKRLIAGLSHVHLALQVHDEVVVIVREDLDIINLCIEHMVWSLERTTVWDVPILVAYEIRKTWDGAVWTPENVS